MANRNFPNNKLYQFEIQPVLLSCNFLVDATQPEGISGLKGAGIEAVYMHSSSPSSANPNPASGIIQVQLSDNYNKFLSGIQGMIASPNAGSALTAVSANLTYVITALGTATLAQWQAKGLPVGVAPAVGAAFTATASGTIGGSATVKVPGVSGLSCIEVVGSPNASLALSQSAINGGGLITLQCLAPTVNTGAYVSPMVATAPAAGSLITLSFYLSNSSVTLSGQ